MNKNCRKLPKKNKQLAINHFISFFNLKIDDMQQK